MKRFSLVTLLLCVLSLTAFARRGKQPIAFTALPQNVQTEVLKNFMEDQVQIITSEKKVGRKEYEFMMADETVIMYDNKAQLRKVKNPQGIKDLFVPENILQYVQKTFPNATITKYSHDRLKQEVELNDKMELVFNNWGTFLRIED